MSPLTKPSAAIKVLYACLFLLACLLACQTWINPDIFVHIVRGNAYLAQHSITPTLHVMEANPEGNTVWIYQIFTSMLTNGLGLTATQLLLNALCLTPFLVIFLVTPVLRENPVGIIWFLPALILSETRFSPRPEVLSWLFVVLQIYGLEQITKSSKKHRTFLALLFAMQIVWVNIHSYFPIALLITAIYVATSRLRDSAQSSPTKTFVILFILQFIAGFITPFGIGAYQLVFDYSAALSQLSGYISEFQSPWSVISLWNAKLFIAYTVVTFTVAVFGLKRNPQTALLGILGVLLGCFSVRMMPMTIVLTWPLWASLVEQYKIRNPRVERTLLLSAVTVSILLICGAASGYIFNSYGSVRTIGLGNVEGAFPTKIASHLKEHDFTGRIFNDSASGGFLNYYAPSPMLYGDSIFVKAERVKKYLHAYEYAPYAVLDKEHAFDAVVAHTVRMAPLIQSLAANSDWKLAAGELNWSLWVKRGSASFREDLIAPPDIYNGESLAIPANRESLNHWFHVLLLSGRISHLERLINSLSPAVQLPPDIRSRLQELAMASGRPEFIEKVLQLNGKKH